MSTAFAIDKEGFTLEDATQSFEIADMIKKGKMVRTLSHFADCTLSSSKLS